MKIQIHTPKGTLLLDTDINTKEEFTIHGLDRDKLILTEKSTEEKITIIEQKIIAIESQITEIVKPTL